MDTQAVIIKRCRGRRTIQETVLIPSDDALIAASLELRRLGEHTYPAAGKHGSLIGLYIPPRQYYLQDVDPFTGTRGETRRGGTIPETCAFWLGSDARVAEAMYERNPIEIYYYCTRSNGIQHELFDDSSQVEIAEGAPRIVERTEYERNPLLRELCLKEHGSRCAVCGFDFQGIYGDCAKRFIHVHHLTPLSQVSTAHVVDPKRDLLPVCPNCHAVIHLKDPPYTPNEVRKMVKKRS